MAKSKSLEFDGIQHSFLNLALKSSAQLSFSFVSSDDKTAVPPEQLLVFLSGLDNPAYVWQRTLNKLVEFARANSVELPPMLFYDRFGVGKSDPDPKDEGKKSEEYHDCNDSVSDLRGLIVHILGQQYELNSSAKSKVRIVFCAHSFGVCVARLYAQAFPGTVEGLLILDSAIAAIPAEKLIPNPDIPEEWSSRQTWGGLEFPDESVITAEMCRDAIRKTRASPISGYTMTTRERIRWNNMPQLLPFSDRPKLQGPTARLPLVTVIVADPKVSIRRQALVSRHFQASRPI
jgi:pimeloyl-ACP methyl ester carboxylesterase